MGLALEFVNGTVTARQEVLKGRKRNNKKRRDENEDERRRRQIKRENLFHVKEENLTLHIFLFTSYKLNDVALFAPHSASLCGLHLPILIILVLEEAR